MASFALEPSTAATLLSRSTDQMRAPQRLEINAMHAALRLCDRVDDARGPGLMKIDLRIGEEPAAVFLPDKLFHGTLGTLFGETYCEGFDAARLPLLFEATLADQIDELEALLETTIAIEAIGRLGPGDHTTAAEGLQRVQYKAHIASATPTNVWCDLPDNVALKLIKSWYLTDDDGNVYDPEIEVRLQMGLSTLTESQLREMAPGDVIMLEASPLPDKRLLLTANDAIATHLKLGEQPWIEHPFRPIDEIASEYAYRQRVAAYAQKSFPVAVDLARTYIPLSTLERLRSDEPFVMPHGIDGPTTLFIGKMEIATGYLVRVGAEFGIKLERVNENE